MSDPRSDTRIIPVKLYIFNCFLNILSLWNYGGWAFLAVTLAYMRTAERKLVNFVTTLRLLVLGMFVDRRLDLVWSTAMAQIMAADYWPVWIVCIMVHSFKPTQHTMLSCGVASAPVSRDHSFVDCRSAALLSSEHFDSWHWQTART